MASADVLGLEPARLQVCGKHEAAQAPPQPAGGHPVVPPLGRGAGPAAAEDWHAGLPGPLEAEGGLQLLSELTNASKVAVWDSVLALVLE